MLHYETYDKTLASNVFIWISVFIFYFRNPSSYLQHTPRKKLHDKDAYIYPECIAAPRHSVIGKASDAPRSNICISGTNFAYSLLLHIQERILEIAPASSKASTSSNPLHSQRERGRESYSACCFHWERNHHLLSLCSVRCLPLLNSSLYYSLI